MREAERVEIPIHPWSLPSMVVVPQQPRCALAVAFSPETGVRDAEYVRWRAAPGDPIARAGSPLDLHTQLLGGSVSSIASSPILEQIAIGGGNGVLQFAAETLSLIAAWTLPNLKYVEALAFSPDGRYLAVAYGHERVALVPLRIAGAERGIPEGANALQIGQASASGSMHGGEYTGCLAFTPDGRTLIAGCSFEGGTALMLADVGEGSDTGALLNPRELGRSDNRTPEAEFCDVVVSLSASPTGRALALFETAQGGGSFGKTPGWRGVLSLADAPFEAVRWSTPIDARLTGDPSPVELYKQRNNGGYYTDTVFIGEDEVACGVTAGRLLCFDAQTGARTRTIDLPARYQSAEVRCLATGAAPGELWCVVILDNTYQVLCLDARR